MFYVRDIVTYRGDEVTLATVKKMVSKPPSEKNEKEIVSIISKRLKESCFPRIELFYLGTVKIELHARRIIEELIGKNGIF